MRVAPILLALLSSTLFGFAAAPPNIVIILADDYGYGSAGCYGADGKLVQTPNLDRLAAEGRRFTDANTTSSVCSPTRYSVLTGRYCWRTSLDHEVLSTFAPLHIEPTRLNMASLLKRHGYNTAAIGKWHLGYGTSDGSPRWRTDYTAELSPGPLDLGFNYHFGVPSNHGDVTGVYVENRFVYGLRSGKIPPGMKLPGPVPDDDDFKATYTAEDTEGARGKPIEIDAPRRVNDRVMPTLTDRAVHWLEAQKPGTPFFLYYTPVTVHNPVTPEKDLAGKSAAGSYGDWILELDRSVGRILETLQKMGVAQDTLVIFTSDNGGVHEPARADSPQALAEKAGLAINGSWRGGKHHIWEGGFRVPFIVRWPGNVPAGTVCDETISLADILATTATLVDERLPTPAAGAEDSYDILPAMLGSAYLSAIRRDIILHSSDGVFAIRKWPWKWIEGVPVDDITPAARKAHAAEFHPQLYQLVEDPGETHDVSAGHPEVVEELRTLLIRYREGGYSRDLPPPPEPKAELVTTLPPLPGHATLEAPLDRMPEAPWKATFGKWEARDGAVWGAQKPDDKPGAALRVPLSGGDLTLQYDLLFHGADRHSLRIETAEGGHSFRIVVSRKRLEITKNPARGEGQDQTEPLVQATLKLSADRWYTLRVSLHGKEATAEIDGVKLTGSHPVIGEPKAGANLLVFGGTIGFRHFQAVPAAGAAP
jgi:arylsulfatase A-like enzyme